MTLNLDHRCTRCHGLGEGLWEWLRFWGFVCIYLGPERLLLALLVLLLPLLGRLLTLLGLSSGVGPGCAPNSRSGETCGGPKRLDQLALHGSAWLQECALACDTGKRRTALI